MKKTAVLASIFMSLSIAGCAAGIPLSHTEIIPDSIAKTPQGLETKIKSLQLGTSLTNVIQSLNIKNNTPGVTKVIDADAKQRKVYGNVVVQGSPEQAEQFRKQIGRFEIYEIQMSITGRHMKITPWKFSATTTNSGPEMLIRLIFFDDKLFKVEEAPSYKMETTTSYATSAIPEALGGSVGVGMKSIK